MSDRITTTFEVQEDVDDESERQFVFLIKIQYKNELLSTRRMFLVQEVSTRDIRLFDFKVLDDNLSFDHNCTFNKDYLQDYIVLQDNLTYSEVAAAMQLCVELYYS